MDSHDALRALRTYLRKQRASYLESMLTTTNVEKTRGRVVQIDETLIKLTELLQSTEGETDDRGE